MKHSLIMFFIALLVTGFLISFCTVIQPVMAQENTFSDDFSSDSTQWQYFGVAHRDAVNQNLILNPEGSMQAGVAYFNSPIQGPFTANFRYRSDHPSDGFTMFFYKQQYPKNIDFFDSFSQNSTAGWRSGFNTGSIIPGYGIEFDDWQNIPEDFEQLTGAEQNPLGDPSSEHIALVKDFTGNHLAYVDDPRIYDGQWHNVTVEVDLASVNVFIDQDLVLQWNGTLDRTFSGFGFSAANGQCGSRYHIVDDVSISASSLNTPTLTTSCVPSVTQTNFYVQITGQLAFNDEGIIDAPIYLSYSVTGGETWQDLTLVNTNADGDYSALWMLSATGNYMLKAVYRGDETHLGETNVVSFVVEPFSSQSAFSVTSNSTVTAFSFDSTQKTLSFNVTGESGSTGFVDVSIPKSLMNDTSGLTLTLDGNQIDYTVESLSENWLLSFTYHHSSHQVMINLDSPNPPENSYLGYIIYVVVAAVGLVVATTALMLKKRQKSNNK
ncbi:MAG: hypothetical protein NWF01_05450 [Candidatus Bathyarchaeota archaeon]|nr:hypothetical protein [Candidatus Bathyarchaeota archaeon]